MACGWSSRVACRLCAAAVCGQKRGMKLFIIKRNSSRKTNRRIIFCSPYANLENRNSMKILVTLASELNRTNYRIRYPRFGSSGVLE